MRNSKGFTLIELLAVIIILAIVALVTTPTITSTINNSRLEGAKDKAWGTIDGIKLAYAQITTNTKTMNITVDLPATVTFGSVAEGAKASGKITSVTSGTVTSTDGTTTAYYAINENFNVNGEIPQSGSVQFKGNGKIIANQLKYTGNGEYYCSTANNGSVMVCDANEDNVKPTTEKGKANNIDTLDTAKATN